MPANPPRVHGNGCEPKNPKQRNSGKGALKTLMPLVEITGERGNKRYQVLFHGHEIWLTQTDLVALLNLVIARATLQAGFIHVARNTVYRLRHAFNHDGGGETTAALIETGANDEYRLTTARADLATHVVLRAACFEMHLRDFSEEQMTQLRGLCSVIDPPLAEPRRRKDTKKTQKRLDTATPRD